MATHQQRGTTHEEHAAPECQGLERRQGVHAGVCERAHLLCDQRSQRPVCCGQEEDDKRRGHTDIAARPRLRELRRGAEDLSGQVQATAGAEEPADVRAGRRGGALSSRDLRPARGQQAVAQDRPVSTPVGHCSHVINECNGIDNIFIVKCVTQCGVWVPL